MIPAMSFIFGADMISIPLSDDDWSRVSYLFVEDEVPRFGRPRRNAREVLDAVLWVIVNGEKWHRLPPMLSPCPDLLYTILEMEEVGHIVGCIHRVGNHLLPIVGSMTVGRLGTGAFFCMVFKFDTCFPLKSRPA
jgi:hypothetical protein